MLLAVGALIVVLPFLGKGGILLSAILAMTVVGAPVFVLLGIVCILCFVLWGGVTTVTDLTIIERIRSLADNQALLAIPFFVMSGNVMRHGEISKRLAGFAQALFGWLPGGLAVSTVAACIFFAAISGSSPSTVVAIGSMMAPALINKGYKESFSHGLVTSAGSLGILIPPSIPMIVYQIVNTRAHIELERLWFSGYGPALVIGLVLATLGIVHGIRHKIPRQPFSARTLLKEARDGFWSLMFPLLIYLGIRHGFVNAIEAACFAVVYAVTIEVFVHRALELRDLPGIFQETGIMLGSFLVILVAAMTFGEFLDQAGLPQMATQWVRDAHLAPWQFLIAVNLLLLVVGCLLDILSAIFVFVPLLAPMAVAAGINPYHFGIIFIVNMEIGYLTPPVGLNLFIASTLFDKSVGYLTRAVLPFVGVMLIGLTYITFDGGASSIGLSNRLLGAPPTLARRPDGRDVHGGRAGGRPGVGAGGSGEAASGGGDMSGSAGGASLEDMLRQAEEQVAAEHHDAGSPDSGPTSRDAGSPDAGSTSASRVGEP